MICVSSVSAFDLNNDTVIDEVSDDLDDTIKVDDGKKDVDLTSNETIGFYGNEKTKLEVHVKDKEGNNVNEGLLTFVNVFGQNYTVDVKDGVAASDVFVGDTGKFNITCSYIGASIYKNANSTILLNVPIADTLCNNIVATRYDEAVYFSGNVVADYKPYFADTQEVIEGNLTVFVDGQELGKCSLDVNGNFVYIWKTTRNLIGETINFTAYFNDDLNHYKPSNFSRLFTFTSKRNTTIMPTVSPIDEDNVLVTGTVVDNNGNAVIGGTLTINDEYSVFVDTNGNFKFYLSNKTTGNATYELGVMDWGSKADITINEPLMNSIQHTELIDQIIDLCKQGSPYIKFGNGNGKTVVVNVGTHGGELASQVAGFKLINLLSKYGDEIQGTIYVFPVIFPEATANNVRIFNGTNLNTVAMVNNSISNNLVKFAKSINASGLGDFHCTRHSDSDVGITCVMCSLNPTFESFLIGEYITNETGYDFQVYQQAGDPYAGAIEDYSNLLLTPAVTCEVLTNHRAVEYGSPEISFNMMKSFLGYFGFDISEMVNIPLKSKENIKLAFESPYNYNSSEFVIDKNLLKPAAQITAENAAYVINYGGKYSVTLKTLNGKVLANKMVTFTLDGKNMESAVTNEKGVATIVLSSKILKTVKYGKKNLVIKFGDNVYRTVSKTVKIAINKEKTTISANKKSFNKSKKVKKYAIFLKDSKRKAIKKTKVILKVKGKKYKATTDVKGKATFKINKLTKKGQFTAKVNYKGSALYKAVTKKVKITIK